jgi:hypothetical protein
MNTLNPLEFDTVERDRFERLTHSNEKAQWRRLIEKLTGGLPTYARRGKPGRPKKN